MILAGHTAEAPQDFQLFRTTDLSHVAVLDAFGMLRGL